MVFQAFPYKTTGNGSDASSFCKIWSSLELFCRRLAVFFGSRIGMIWSLRGPWRWSVESFSARVGSWRPYYLFKQAGSGVQLDPSGVELSRSGPGRPHPYKNMKKSPPRGSRGEVRFQGRVPAASHHMGAGGQTQCNMTLCLTSKMSKHRLCRFCFRPRR